MTKKSHWQPKQYRTSSAGWIKFDFERKKQTFPKFYNEFPAFWPLVIHLELVENRERFSAFFRDKIVILVCRLGWWDERNHCRLITWYANGMQVKFARVSMSSGILAWLMTWRKKSIIWIPENVYTQLYTVKCQNQHLSENFLLMG